MTRGIMYGGAVVGFGILALEAGPATTGAFIFNEAQSEVGNHSQGREKGIFITMQILNVVYFKWTKLYRIHTIKVKA